MNLLIALALLAARPASAQQGEDPFRLFEEEARVVTASRRPEFARHAPAAVEVVTAEEIRASGAVNLWDLLRFRLGMHVIDGRSGEGNRALVSIRGFPKEFVDSLLVLVDGRSVYTGLSGGAVWETLPVQLHDIERIEIVRGPTAALYGSNAGLGVVNIITRAPEAGREVYADALAGTGGLLRQQAAYEDGGRAGAYRLSFTRKVQDGHPAASGGRANDFLSSWKGNFRGSWTLTPKSMLEAFSGGGWDAVGIVDAMDPQYRSRQDFEMLRYVYDPAPGSSVQAMVARRDETRTFDPSYAGLLTVRERQHDAELTHRFDWLDGSMQTVYGGSLRYTGIESAEIFPDGPRQKNAVQRGFLSQSWTPLPILRLVGAASVERSDTGGVEPAMQAALIASPSAAHTFRLSYGLAPTIPPLYQVAARHRVSAGVLLAGNPDIRPQRLSSHEAGWQGAFLEKRLLLEADLFYLHISGLRRSATRSFVLAPQPLLTLSFDNGSHADASGAEARVSYRWGAGRWTYANYVYETIAGHDADTNVVRGTPRHRLNLGASASLGAGLSASVNAGYQDAHTLFSELTGLTRDIPSYWRLDARLAWRLPRLPDAEVYAAAQNLLAPRHREFADGLLVPRTWLGGLSLRFR